MKRKWEVTLILYFKSSIYFLRRKVISKKGIVLFSYFYYTSMTVDICDRHGHTYCLIWSSDQKDKQNNSAKSSYLSSTTYKYHVVSISIIGTIIVSIFLVCTYCPYDNVVTGLCLVCDVKDVYEINHYLELWKNIFFLLLFMLLG